MALQGCAGVRRAPPPRALLIAHHGVFDDVFVVSEIGFAFPPSTLGLAEPQHAGR